MAGRREADHLVVAIDGPAAAGKSTVASAVAHRLDALYFDTGVIYRALTLAARERGVDPSNAPALARLASELDVRLRPASKADRRHVDVLLGDRDVTWAIRSPEVDRAVSVVSAHPEVRNALLGLQRTIGRQGRVVMLGRDIGTVVMPDADLKIWLDASLEERARRRWLELTERGVARPLDEVRTEMAERDRLDAQRAVAPMRPAEDAIVIPTDGRSVGDDTDEIVRRAAVAEQKPRR